MQSSGGARRGDRLHLPQARGLLWVGVPRGPRLVSCVLALLSGTEPSADPLHHGPQGTVAGGQRVGAQMPALHGGHTEGVVPGRA